MTASRRDALNTLGLILLALVPAIAGVSRLGQLAGGAAQTAANARFIAMPAPVVLHILSVIPFSLLGAFQFSGTFRRRHMRWHRTAGKVLGVLGLLAAISGLWMTLVYPWPEGDGVALFYIRLVVGAAMLSAIALGIEAVRRRDFESHGAWMVRGYAIGMGAGTQVLTHLPWFIFVNAQPGELPRAIMMGGAWLINIVVAELIISRHSARKATIGETRAARRAGMKAARAAAAASTASANA